MPIPVIRAESKPTDPLKINAELVADWLVHFLRHECQVRRNMNQAVVGLSGGVDSAVTAHLCARAFGPKNVLCVRMPYKISSAESLDHAQLIVDQLGVQEITIPITGMVDGYLETQAGGVPSHRVGNVCARARMIILFDQAARIGGLPIGTGNKSERLFGYFTWHADDSPPINPLGDLFKSQVWEVARALGVPDVIVDKPASADLIQGQTDEGDFGITYEKADHILHAITLGATRSRLLAMGFDPHDVELVWKRVDSTHWKRRLPTVAMLSRSAIGEFYLRPVDY